MLCTLKGITSKVFIKGVINKISIKVFSSNSNNTTNQVFFKGVINQISFKVFSFNFWNNPIAKDQSGSWPTGTFKRPKVAHSLVALSKDQKWLTVCWHFQKRRSGS